MLKGSTISEHPKSPADKDNPILSDILLVGKGHLQVNVTLTRDQAIAAMGTANVTKSEAAMESTLDLLRKQKKTVSNWARNRVTMMFIEEAMQINVQFCNAKNTNIQGTKKMWRCCGLEENALKLFSVTFGQFDHKFKWDIELEQEFMTTHNWEYKPCVPDVKGFIAKFISHAKVDLVKQINEASVATHGKKISISQNRKVAPATIHSIDDETDII